MPRVARTVKKAVIIIAIAIMVLLVRWCLLYPPYSVEERHVLKDGGVRFKRIKPDWQRLEMLSSDWEDGLELHVGAYGKIRHKIYGDNATYLFTTDGRVYAMSGNEFGVPASLLEQWKWAGNPYDFPYYGKKYPSDSP